MSQRTISLLLVTLALAPVAAAADEEPPCQPASPADSRLVEVTLVPGTTELRSRDGGVAKIAVVNRSGRVLCRVLAQVSLDGRERPATCYRDDGIKPTAEGQIFCRFPLLPGEGPRGVADRGNRQPGQPAKSTPPKTKLKVTGLDLADVVAYRAWEDRRVVAARKAAERAEAARQGFRQTLTFTRGDGKEARQPVGRALVRLKECILERAKRNPKLALTLKLRLGVSRARTPDAEGLLAVKVLRETGLGEVRQCVSALDLFEVPPRCDFEAITDVTYRPATP